MKQIVYVIRADNGQSYDEHDSWNTGYIIGRDRAIKYVDAVNKMIDELYAKAQAAQWKRRDKEVYVGLYETAAGKRLRKYLEGHSIISKKDTYATEGHITLTCMVIAQILEATKV